MTAVMGPSGQSTEAPLGDTAVGTSHRLVAGKTADARGSTVGGSPGSPVPTGGKAVAEGRRARDYPFFVG